MAFSLIPLCSTSKQACRDGLTGAYASIPLPFYAYGRYFFSGQQYTWNNTLVPQDKGMTLRGLTQVNTYQKDCCNCLDAGGNDITYVAP